MSSTVTFDGVNLSDPQEYESQYLIETNEVKLLSGKVSVHTNPNLQFKATFKCVTENFSDISNLLLKAGAKGTLVIGGESHINCKIIGQISVKEPIFGLYEYTVSFAEETK